LGNEISLNFSLIICNRSKEKYNMDSLLNETEELTKVLLPVVKLKVPFECRLFNAMWLLRLK